MQTKTERWKGPEVFKDVLELFMPKKKKNESKTQKRTNAFEDGASRQILDSLKRQSQRLEGRE